MTWIFENPIRFLHEQSEIKKLESEVDWLSHVWKLNSGIITIDFEMKIHGLTFEATLNYPNIFPDTPAFIIPRETNEQWSHHQYGPGGSLCLEWRPDNWRPEITAADLIKSAYKLLIHEKNVENPSTLPSAHSLSQGQSVRNKWQRFVVTNDLITLGQNYSSPIKRTIKTLNNFNEDSLVTFVYEASNSQGNLEKISDIPAGLTDEFNFDGFKETGYLFQHKNFDRIDETKSTEDLIKLLTIAGFSTEDVVTYNSNTNKYVSRLIIIQGIEKHSFRIFRIPALDELRLNEMKLILPSPKNSRLPENTNQFKNVRICIVGLGSIGSKIAVSLVRSGIKNFLLIDDDYLESGNLVRNELSFSDIGRNKVDAVKNVMNLIETELEITTNTTRIHGQESSLSMASCLTDILNCDIIIDATANPDVFLILAALSKRKKIPLFWGEIFAGGCGGIISRAHPNFDPNPFAIRDGFHEYLMDLPPAPFKNATNYDNTDEIPLVAFDCDVTFIASALTRLVIDCIDTNTPNKFTYPIYLIGMSKEWDFIEPFDTRPVQIDGEGWDNILESPSEENIVDVLKALESMIDND